MPETTRNYVFLENVPKECQNCKFYVTGKDGSSGNFCSKNGVAALPGSWCNSFEYRAEFVNNSFERY